jgi:hypothetical protein
MSTSQFPHHPEHVPPMFFIDMEHRLWLDETRAKYRRKAIINQLRSWKMWWTMFRFLSMPLIGAVCTSWPIAATLDYSTRRVSPTGDLITTLVMIACCASFLIGFYTDAWPGRKHSFKARAGTIFLGLAAGALAGVVFSILPTYMWH